MIFIVNFYKFAVHYYIAFSTRYIMSLLYIWIHLNTFEYIWIHLNTFYIYILHWLSYKMIAFGLTLVISCIYHSICVLLYNFIWCTIYCYIRMSRDWDIFMILQSAFPESVCGTFSAAKLLRTLRLHWFLSFLFSRALTLLTIAIWYNYLHIFLWWYLSKNFDTCSGGPFL